MHTSIAVDVPTSPSGTSVFDPFPPTTAEPLAGPVTAPEPVVVPTAVSSPPPPPPPAGPARRERRIARRRSRVAVVLGVLLIAALIVIGLLGAALAREEDGAPADPPAAAPAPAAAADADVPAADADADVPPGDADRPADAADVDGAADPADVAQAADALDSFLEVRGTDAARAVSSAGGRAELDAVIAQAGAATPAGDPECTAVGLATFACVLDTDRGPITFTVGPDPDEPTTSGFEVIGASIA